MLLLLASLVPFAACLPLAVVRSWRKAATIAAASLFTSFLILLYALPVKPSEEYYVERALDLIVLEGSGFNMLFAVAAAALCSLQAIVAPYYLGRSANHYDARLFYFLFLISSDALILTPLSGSLTTFFLFFEMYLLSSWLLLLAMKDRRAGRVATKYLVFTEVGALITLLGLAIVYDTYRTFRIGELLPLVSQSEEAWPLLLVLMGPLVKMAVFPLHAWISDVYSIAAEPVIGIMVVAEGSAGWVVAKVMGALNSTPYFQRAWLPFLAVGLTTLVYGSLTALTQSNYRKLLAYSSMGEGGLMVIGAACGGDASLVSVTLLFYQHALAKTALLLSYGYLEDALETDVITQYGGLARFTPGTALAVLIASLSLAGAPPTLGFWAELEVLASVAKAAAEAGLSAVGISVAVAIAMVIPAAYSIWWYKRVFFGNPRLNVKEASLRLVALEMLPAVALVVLGVFPSLIISLIG